MDDKESGKRMTMLEVKNEAEANGLSKEEGEMGTTVKEARIEDKVEVTETSEKECEMKKEEKALVTTCPLPISQHIFNTWFLLGTLALFVLMAILINQ